MKKWRGEYHPAGEDFGIFVAEDEPGTDLQLLRFRSHDFACLPPAGSGLGALRRQQLGGDVPWERSGHRLLKQLPTSREEDVFTWRNQSSLAGEIGSLRDGAGDQSPALAWDAHREDHKKEKLLLPLAGMV